MTNIYVSGRRYGDFVARIPAIPGCGGVGPTADEAVSRARHNAARYLELLGARGVTVSRWAGLDAGRFAVVQADGSGFPEDDEAMAEGDAALCSEMFRATSEVFMERSRSLGSRLDEAPGGSAWPASEVLRHVAAEQVRWLALLDACEGTPLRTVEVLRELVITRFAAMAPGTPSHEGHRGHWTPRKVARRILEHEFEHAGQLEEIADALAQADGRSGTVAART